MDFGFDIALAFRALDRALDLGEHIFRFAEFLTEMLVVKQLFFVLNFYIVCCFDGCFFVREIFVSYHVIEVGS